MNNVNYAQIKLKSMTSNENSTENIIRDTLASINEKHASYLGEVNLTDEGVRTGIDSLYTGAGYQILLARKVKTDLNICGSEFVKDVTLIETEDSQKIVVALHNSVLKKPNSIIEITRNTKTQKTASKFISDNQEKCYRTVSNNLVEVFKSDKRTLETFVVAILLDFDAIKSNFMPNALKYFENYK